MCSRLLMLLNAENACIVCELNRNYYCNFCGHHPVVLTLTIFSFCAYFLSSLLFIFLTFFQHFFLFIFFSISLLLLFLR